MAATVTTNGFNHERGFGLFKLDRTTSVIVFKKQLLAAGFKPTDMDTITSAEIDFTRTAKGLKTTRIHRIGDQCTQAQNKGKSKKQTGPEAVPIGVKAVAFIQEFNGDRGFGKVAIFGIRTDKGNVLQTQDSFADVFLHITDVPTDLRDSIYDEDAKLFDIEITTDQHGRPKAVIQQLTDDFEYEIKESAAA